MINHLASWKSKEDGGTGSKEAIMDFVENVASKIDPADRIATFDNDGTLWSERPRYFQEYFIFPALLKVDHVVDEHAENKQAPLTKKELWQKDKEHYIGKTTEEYITAANQFVQDTNHPIEKFNSYKLAGMTYQPLIELLNYLRANEFKVYICSGGGRDFVRSFAQQAYGIPPENVIGSSIVTEYDPSQGSGGDVVRTKVAETNAKDQADKGLGQYNDKEGKPVGIQRQIGKRPILACGNSTGDLQMFDYTDQGAEKSLIVLINHDDEDREFKYNDTEALHRVEDFATGDSFQVEPNNASLIKANKPENPHWRVVSMKDDFKQIFPAK
ncbi:MAG: HAD family hydrolase [Cyanobacteria bacterium J06642_3]